MYGQCIFFQLTEKITYHNIDVLKDFSPILRIALLIAELK